MSTVVEDQIINTLLLTILKEFHKEVQSHFGSLFKGMTDSQQEVIIQ